jgi:serine/threonine-protein kinase
VARKLPADFAIKVLKFELESDTVEVRRFRQEAAIGRRFVHPNLVPVLAAGLSQPPYYLVMPFLAGATVRDLLRIQGPCVVPHALWITRQVSDALSALHLTQWRHGDVQPGNIMVNAQGHATLIDLGCASACQQEVPLHQHLLTGHLAYVAPEQLVRRIGCGPPSDVYSLGITLFEMLSGRRPFPDADPERMAEFHLRTVPPSARTWRPELPREVAQCVARMLAKDSARRPTTDGELQSLLSRLEIGTFDMRAPAVLA